ncbi:MAG TPA: hypothetical protein VJN70_19990, partial [Gemmatimonadaceae bacterium]|nr:hypothetical protein [Gemmatimonadaceae bacterium]
MPNYQLEIRRAETADVPTLVALMQSFYAEASFALPTGSATRAFQALLADPRLGSVWLAEDESGAIGHLVLTLCFSMEYGGLRG